MKITVVTLFPEMVRGFVNESIVRRAQDKKLVEIEIVNLRDFSTDKYKTVDGKPYGGGAGMVLRADVLAAALASVSSPDSKVYLTSAKGKTFNQSKARELSQLGHIVIIAGHYEGVDERILKNIDEEVSLGDFVMTGGEITAAAIIDSAVRLIPGVLKKDEATDIESFKTYKITDLEKVLGTHAILENLKKQKITEVQLLEYPHYTRPDEFDGEKVPGVLTSGNHADIETWRLRQSFEETLRKRPDLLNGIGRIV